MLKVFFDNDWKYKENFQTEKFYSIHKSCLFILVKFCIQ